MKPELFKVPELFKLDESYSDVLADLHPSGFDRPWSKNSFATLFADPNIFAYGLKTDPEPAALIGYIICRWLAPEAEVLTLLIRPEQRKKGYAERLVEKSLSHIRDQQAKFMFLEVAENNVAALALYHRLGFQQSGRRAGYYAGIDAILMQYIFEYRELL